MKKKTKECRNCPLNKAVHKGRAYWVCPDCGRDMSLEYLIICEAKNKMK